MKLSTAIKRAKAKSNGNKELYRLKLFGIGMKYFRAFYDFEFQREWQAVNK